MWYLKCTSRLDIDVTNIHVRFNLIKSFHFVMRCIKCKMTTRTLSFVHGVYCGEEYLLPCCHELKKCCRSTCIYFWLQGLAPKSPPSRTNNPSRPQSGQTGGKQHNQASRPHSSQSTVKQQDKPSEKKPQHVRSDRQNKSSSDNRPLSSPVRGSAGRSLGYKANQNGKFYSNCRHIYKLVCEWNVWGYCCVCIRDANIRFIEFIGLIGL